MVQLAFRCTAFFFPFIWAGQQRAHRNLEAPRSAVSSVAYTRMVTRALSSSR
ncbi:hypothetical protein DEFR109230_13065 [Deinococcus frigens]